MRCSRLLNGQIHRMERTLHAKSNHSLKISIFAYNVTAGRQTQNTFI